MRGAHKAYFVLASIFAAIVIFSYQLGGRPGLLWGFILCLFAHWLIFIYGDQRLLKLFRSERLQGQDPWGVLDQLDSLSKRARIPTPRVYMVESDTMNAYSIAKHHKKSSIVLTSKLVSDLSPGELKAVLAHEVARIQRLDTINLSVTSAIMTFAFFLTSLKQPEREKSSRIKRWAYAFFLHLLGPLSALLRSLVVNSQTYYAIDRRAAELTQSPMSHAQMLWKLQSYASTQPSEIPPAAAHLFIVNPLTKKGWGRYFQAQPPLENRIRRLIGYYPI